MLKSYRLDPALYPDAVKDALNVLYVAIKSTTDWDAVQITFLDLNGVHYMPVAIDVQVQE